MTCKHLGRWLRPVILTLCSLPLTGLAADLDEVERLAEQRVERNATAEHQVAALADEARGMELEYRQLLAELEQLDVYNRLLQSQVDGQLAELADIEDAITEAAGMEQRLLPLVTEMIDGLDQFVRLDLPFLSEERQVRVDRLRASLSDPQDSLAATLRKTFEAYEAEAEYARTLETYRQRIRLGDREREVDVLRFGRLGLLYRTLDRQALGAWNAVQGQWVALDASQWQMPFERALRVARKQTAPDLLAIPLFYQQEATQ